MLLCTLACTPNLGCSLILWLQASLSGDVSIHQHTPPTRAHVSLCLHTLTPSFCSQTQHISSVSGVQVRNAALPSDGLTVQVSYISASTRKISFCHHRASVPHWIPSAQVLYLKKLYQFLALDDHCLLQDDIASSEDGLTSINPGNVLPSLSKWLTPCSWQQWALLVFGWASWLDRKEAIETLDCGPQRGWGMLRDTLAAESCRAEGSQRVVLQV